MTKVGLIADTHSYFDPQIKTYFDDRDEIWHAGDFGDWNVVERLRDIAPVIGVYGNVDGNELRKEFPQHQRFNREGVEVWMTHIGGSPGRYALPIREEIDEDPPDLFICGHSHILKIARDPDLQKMIFMNPGAAGRHGFQVYRTCVRFEIFDGGLHNVEVINLGEKNSKVKE